MVSYTFRRSRKRATRVLPIPGTATAEDRARKHPDRSRATEPPSEPTHRNNQSLKNKQREQSTYQRVTPRLPPNESNCESNGSRRRLLHVAKTAARRDTHARVSPLDLPPTHTRREATRSRPAVGTPRRRRTRGARRPAAPVAHQRRRRRSDAHRRGRLSHTLLDATPPPPPPHGRTVAGGALAAGACRGCHGKRRGPPTAAVAVQEGRPPDAPPTRGRPLRRPPPPLGPLRRTRGTRVTGTPAARGGGLPGARRAHRRTPAGGRRGRTDAPPRRSSWSPTALSQRERNRRGPCKAVAAVATAPVAAMAVVATPRRRGGCGW